MMDSFWDVFWGCFISVFLMICCAIILVLPVILCCLFESWWWLLGLLFTVPFVAAVAYECDD